MPSFSPGKLGGQDSFESIESYDSCDRLTQSWSSQSSFQSLQRVPSYDSFDSEDYPAALPNHKPKGTFKDYVRDRADMNKDKPVIPAAALAGYTGRVTVPKKHLCAQHFVESLCIRRGQSFQGLWVALSEGLWGQPKAVSFGHRHSDPHGGCKHWALVCCLPWMPPVDFGRSWGLVCFVENAKRALVSPLPLSCSALASCLWFPTSGRTGCVSALLCMMHNDLIPFQREGRNFVLLFVLVRDRDGMLPKQIQAFSIPCNER